MTQFAVARQTKCPILRGLRQEGPVAARRRSLGALVAARRGR